MSGLRITDPKALKRLIDKGFIGKDKEALLTSIVKPKAKRRSAADSGFSALIPVMPADILYQAVVRRFGRLYEGGEVVYELECHFDKKYRLDIALPAFKLGLELDGWESHGKYLSGFQRDRAKSLSFERRGWRIVRFSNAQVKHELTDLIYAIEQILSFCEYTPELSQKVRQVNFDKSVFEVLK